MTDLASNRVGNDKPSAHMLASSTSYFTELPNRSSFRRKPESDAGEIAADPGFRRDDGRMVFPSSLTSP
jgi:hypothetical protein